MADACSVGMMSGFFSGDLPFTASVLCVHSVGKGQPKGILKICENLVNLSHHKVSVLLTKAHGGFELEDVPVRSVSTQEDVLFLQSVREQQHSNHSVALLFMLTVLSLKMDCDNILGKMLLIILAGG